MASAARQAEPSETEAVVHVGPLEVRLDEGLAAAKGRVLMLSGREFQLLAALARWRGRIVARTELYEMVWGRPLRDGDRSVDVYVSKLRGKLERALPDLRFIHTHFGFGYRLEPEASQPFHNPGAPE